MKGILQSVLLLSLVWFVFVCQTSWWALRISLIVHIVRDVFVLHM